MYAKTQGSGFIRSKSTVKTQGLGFIRAIMTIKTRVLHRAVARTLFFLCFLVAKTRPGCSPHLGNKNTSKNIGFWQQPEAEPCVFTVIMAQRKPEPCVFACFCCQEEDSILVLSWQQETLRKNKVLATTLCRTLCFYSHNGSEKTWTLCFYRDFGVVENQNPWFLRTLGQRTPRSSILKQ